MRSICSKKIIFVLLLVIGTTALPGFADEEQIYYAKGELDTLVVTATREQKSKQESAESVEVFNKADIESVSPSHPSELINRSAGVHINNLGGEGHMTSIRQPITTRGVYLFLEDGVPTRPSGFFNHNGLYEVNIPQSGNVEVTKGPASALYGSEAIGGVINALTAPPPEETTLMINPEVGSNGWRRLLVSGGGSSGDHGVVLKANYTENQGYRDEADYDRSSLTGRWDYHGSGVATKTTLSYTEVDQSGLASLEEEDYRARKKKNIYHGDTGFRDVEALRISSEISIEQGSNGLLTLTPFYRDNTMKMSPSWMVTYDPNERESAFESYGLLTKYRYDLNDNNQLIVGLDVDYTPSTYKEVAVSHTLDGEIYQGYEEIGVTNYDFEAEQTAVAPYIQLETKPMDALSLIFGVRYDKFDVDYEDQLAEDDPNFADIPQLGRRVTHLRPEDQKLEFEEVSPKFGAVYQLSDSNNVYFNYRHAFRAPSVGSLFRSGSTLNTDKLEPVTADSYELGVRGFLNSALYYELAVYHMEIKDDIVTVVNGFERNTFNAGETHHQGIEVTLNGELTDTFSYAFAYTVTKQTYETFSYSCCFPSQNVDVSGNDVGKAPKTIGNLSLKYEPEFVPDLAIEAELAHLGRYYTDETNENRYPGHNLLNLRTSFDWNDITLYGRVNNVADKRYSEYTSNQVGNDNIGYRLGQPRTYVLGARYRF